MQICDIDTGLIILISTCKFVEIPNWVLMRIINLSFSRFTSASFDYSYATAKNFFHSTLSSLNFIDCTFDGPVNSISVVTRTVRTVHVSFGLPLRVRNIP